jgi:hypothetical protein
MAQDYGTSRSQIPPGPDTKSTVMAFHRPFNPQHYEAGQIQNSSSTPGLREEHHLPQYTPPSQPAAVEHVAVQPMEQRTALQPSKFNHQSSLPLSSQAPEFEFGRPPVPFWRRQINRIELFIVQFFVEWWLLEILSWCFSAICMTAIFAVLLHYDGKEIPQWPMGLTINGFISILSGLSKTALLLPTAEAIGQLKWVSGFSSQGHHFFVKVKLILSRIGSIRRSPEQ